jgi:hypothetical protein
MEYRMTLGFIRHHLLNELLSLPGLIEQVQSLPTETFHQMIQQIGLEDCGELISLATHGQLESLFDADLWKNTAPGETEHFDSTRFALWLEVLMEAGTDIAVEKICEMDEELLVYALSSELLVIPNESLMHFFQEATDNAKQVDILLESCLYEDLYEYQIISRNPDSWDSFLELLVSMDKTHHDLLIELLEQLSYLGNQYVEEDTLHTVLSEIDAMEVNLQDKRDSRRTRKGYVNSTDAKAFLELAHHYSVEDILDSTNRDAITKSYFRTFRPAEETDGCISSPVVSRIVELLNQSSPESSTVSSEKLLAGDVADNQTMLLVALRRLATTASDLYFQRMSELSYLGNIVAAGCSLDGRRMRSVEASNAVLATCALGLDKAMQRNGTPLTVETIHAYLARVAMERLFLLGWKLLPNSSGKRAFPHCSQGTHINQFSFIDSLEKLGTCG